MEDGGGGFPPSLAILLGIIGVVMYWLPSIIAVKRKVPHIGSIIVVNGLAGWTFIGWLVSLAMASRDPR